MSTLTGKRILVVEDEFIIAAMVEDILLEAGAIVIGPVYKIEDGLLYAQRETIDAAILDVNINGASSEAIAETLTNRGIPMVLATGYGAAGLKRFQAPVLDKPYTRESLVAALRRAMASQP